VSLKERNREPDHEQGRHEEGEHDVDADRGDHERIR
jgi:hypothetical protein